MGRCRDHCPGGHGGGGWLHLAVFLVLLVAFCKGVGYVAPVASSMAGAVVAGVVAVLAAGGVVVGGTVAVRAVLNRRARAQWAVIEQEAQAARSPREAPALTASAQQLEAAPSVRAEAFVERDREVA